MIERDADAIQVNGQVIHLPRYTMRQDVGGGGDETANWYINEYVKDTDGTMRRDTIAEGLTQEEAVAVLGQIYDYFAECDERRRLCPRR